MYGIYYYYIRSLDPAVNRREYARYPFKDIAHKKDTNINQHLSIGLF